MSDAQTGLTQAMVDRFNWHHSIDFGNGIVSKGDVPLRILKLQADIYFADLERDTTVLDIGCWDGFNSFEAARRGASRTVATDHFAWSPKGWGQRAAFELARKHLAPNVEVKEIDIPDLNEETVGRFDTVLFAGVFYHLRDPAGAMERAASLAERALIVETLIETRSFDFPMMTFRPIQGGTPWWAPNNACIEEMLRGFGFENVRTISHPEQNNRSIFIARRSP
jgi:tRNA (mo5U34)-methyltransferase